MLFKLIKLDNEKYLICLEKLHKDDNHDIIHIVTINPFIAAEWISKKYNVNKEEILSVIKENIQMLNKINNLKVKLSIVHSLNMYLIKLKGENNDND